MGLPQLPFLRIPIFRASIWSRTKTSTIPKLYNNHYNMLELGTGIEPVFSGYKAEVIPLYEPSIYFEHREGLEPPIYAALQAAAFATRPSVRVSCNPDRSRTDNLLDVSQVLPQLSYRIIFCGLGWSRSSDPLLNRQTLYQLSY